MVAAGARGAPGSWARGEGEERGRRCGGREAAEEAGGGGGRGGGGGGGGSGGGERHRGVGRHAGAEPSRAVATWRAGFEVETDWGGGGKNRERGGCGARPTGAAASLPRSLSQKARGEREKIATEE